MGNSFKKVIDKLRWRQVPPLSSAHSSAVCLASDLRSDVSRNPFVYQLATNTALNRFNIISKGSHQILNPSLAGTFGAGVEIAFAPSFGAVGTLAAGNTATSIILSTALPTAVGANMLANRGGSGDYGFKIRVIGYASGKTEERFITANTASATPTINLNSALSFTPAAGDRYELLCGKAWMLGAGTTAANIWRSFEVGSNTLSTGLSTANLPATINTDSSIMVLDEQYTPYDCNPGEGMIKGSYTYDTGLVTRKALSATATGASAITGEAATGDFGVAANEYRNFQIRIVQDTTTPAAVGQRRVIASHTAGPSAVYTLGTAWTTTPSTSAKFVIELPNLMVMRSTATTTTYTWNYADATINNGTNSIASMAWSTSYFGAAGSAHGAGCLWAPSFGIRPDATKNARHSYCYFFRGGSATLDMLDIAGSITGTWNSALTYDGSYASIGTGSCGCYSPFGNEGRMFYMNIYTANLISQIYRFDVQNRVLAIFAPTEYIQTGTAALGNRMAAYAAIDTDTTYDAVLLQSHASNVAQELVPVLF